ncbi:MAG: hypothetical protein HYT37_04195 [Candidatus Sungbacteria bacterium]|nr:hypothetical protein [Candidatus Sungbacteria bacterium]
MSKKTKNIIFQLVFAAAVIAVAFYFASLVRESDAARGIVVRYGYIGIFVVSIVSGFNLAVPVPAIAFLPVFLEAGLNVWFTIFLITAGMTLADIIAYWFGKIGERILSYSMEQKILADIQEMREKYRWLPIFLLFLFAALVPMPNEIFVIPLGFVGYRLLHVLPAVFAGNLVFNTLYALGIASLFELF